jgi:Zn-dependent M28 family amino/carboxypeptidase
MIRPALFLSARVAALILFALCFGGGFAAGQQSTSLDEELKADLAAGPCKNSDRLRAVKDLFKRNGAAENDIRVDKLKDLQNVVLSKKGKTDEWVVIGAHYDKVSDGCGIIDNWSGIVILAHLYKAMAATETQKGYLFVAFDREEEGLKGSAAMAKAIPKEERPKYCSMVNLDSFGLGYPVILEHTSSSKMVKLSIDLGKELKVPVTPISPSGTDADSSSFKEKGIPAITLSALSSKWQEYMHTSKDKMENVNVSSVRIGYLFAREYVGRVDAGGCGAFR